MTLNPKPQSLADCAENMALLIEERVWGANERAFIIEMADGRFIIWPLEEMEALIPGVARVMTYRAGYLADHAETLRELDPKPENDESPEVVAPGLSF